MHVVNALNNLTNVLLLYVLVGECTSNAMQNVKTYS